MSQQYKRELRICEAKTQDCQHCKKPGQVYRANNGSMLAFIWQEVRKQADIHKHILKTVLKDQASAAEGGVQAV